MSRLRLGFLGLLGTLTLAGLTMLIAAPVLAGDPCYHDFAMPPRTVGTDPQVKVAPCAFAPTVTRIPVGGTVTFFNGEGPAHLITGANQEWGSRDVELGPNATVSYTFDKPGTYPYACALHRGMSGAIVVGDPETALGVTYDLGNGAAARVESRAEGPGAAGGGAALVAGGGAIGIVIGVAAMLILTRRRPTAARPVPRMS